MRKSLWGKEEATETLGDPQKHVAVCPSFWRSLLCVGFFGGCHCNNSNSTDGLANEWEPSKRTALTLMLYIYAVCRKAQKLLKAMEREAEFGVW